MNTVANHAAFDGIEVFPSASVTGIFDDGWMGPEARLSLETTSAVSLYFDLPERDGLPLEKWLKIYSSDKAFIIEVKRGAMSVVSGFVPLNGRVNIQIYCDSLEPTLPEDPRPLTVRLARIERDTAPPVDAPAAPGPETPPDVSNAPDAANRPELAEAPDAPEVTSLSEVPDTAEIPQPPETPGSAQAADPPHGLGTAEGPHPLEAPAPVQLANPPEGPGAAEAALATDPPDGPDAPHTAPVSDPPPAPDGADADTPEALPPDYAALNAYERAALEHLFDRDFYLSGFLPGQVPGDPVAHYLALGHTEGHDPAPWFSGHHYLRLNPDVAAAGMNPFLHYCLAGKAEGRPIARLGRPGQGDTHLAHRFAVEPGPLFEEVDPRIGTGRSPRAKVLAYYLPQFHPVAVNDAQWGTGFTEWRNLPRATAQFTGHVQPRIPRDLGCYDLSQGDAMRRQIEMAKAGGVYGFCFYHYWFDGQRVLETPMERLLADPTLEMPFCLMWANENWTRTWDGSESEVILGQSYRAEDERAFIDDIARHFRDSRYIRVGGRPLFFVYRPASIPAPQETLARWRALFRDHHDVDPLIFMAQGFGDHDPRDHGLDGATEFPPHKLCHNLPPINATLDLLNPAYGGHVVAYEAMVERSVTEPPPAFPLIRTVTPNWDNEPRRPGRGMVIHGSTPEKFGDWVGRMLEYAVQNPIGDEAFLCVNAWNEWAEGAMLEPDVHYGGAYLNALARAVYAVPALRGRNSGKILIIGHDAHINGAQKLALEIGRTLRSQFGLEIAYLLGDEGPLLPSYREIGETHICPPGAGDAAGILRALQARGYVQAITNTTPAGRFVPHLKAAGFRVISLIHELPNLLRSYSLEAEADRIASLSDQVIFPSPVVASGFESFVGKPVRSGAVFPQGLYNTAVLDLPRGDHGVRDELGLPADTRIVLGVGYADMRKGIDRFVSVGLSVCGSHEDIAFVWVGPPAAEASSWLQPEIEAAGLADRVRILGQREDVARFFAAANAYYLSSREDPFPSVVLEALACGLPVVGHAGCGGCDGLIRTHGVLVPPQDPIGAAEALVAVMGYSSARAAAARRREIAKNHDFPAYVFGLMQRLQPGLASVAAVVPAGLGPGALEARLQGILAQSHPLREILVLADPAPGAGLDEIRRTIAAAGRRVTLHLNEETRAGPLAAWRRAAALVCGDYLWIQGEEAPRAPATLADLMAQMQAGGSSLGLVARNLAAGAGAVHDGPFEMSGLEFLARHAASGGAGLQISGLIVARAALRAALDALDADIAGDGAAADWQLCAAICAQPGARISGLVAEPAPAPA